MSSDAQTWIAIAIVAVAVAYVGRGVFHAYRSFISRARGEGKGCGGCGSCGEKTPPASGARPAEMVRFPRREGPSSV